MKVTFSPIINKTQTYFKPLKTNFSPEYKQMNLNGLDCLANYNLSFGANVRAVYSFDYDGNYERFDSMYVAENKNGKKIYNALNEVCASADNKIYVYADTVELPNGEMNSSGIYKALSGFRRARNQPIYSVDFDGNIRRFDDVKSIVDAKITTGACVSLILNQCKDVISGHTFIKAFDVELRDEKGKLLKDENGKPVLDDYAINKLREKFLYTGNGFPIASIDKGGNVIIYRNIKEAALKTNNRKDCIVQSMTNGKLTQKKYTYARLADIVQIDKFGDVVFDENNDFAIDYDKVEEIRKIAFKEGKRLFLEPL